MHAAALLSSSNPPVLSTCIKNNYNDDAYFLTTLASNGVCPAWCPGTRFPNPKPYGVNQVGATTKFLVTTLGGRRVDRAGVQLSQSAYLALQTPYHLFGLGRTNNYLEYFDVGVPLNGRNYGQWVAIIPNSQLVVFPYPHDSPDEWTLELFINPSARLLWVCVAVGVSCVILIIIISYFHYKERKQDEQEKKQTEHLFAF